MTVMIDAWSRQGSICVLQDFCGAKRREDKDFKTGLLPLLRTMYCGKTAESSGFGV